MIEVKNPATGQVIGQIPEHSAADVQDAIGKADSAFPAWSGKLTLERRDILLKWVALIKRDRDAIAKLMTEENGKPLKESQGEIDYGLGFIDWYAEEARRAYGDVIPTHNPAMRPLVFRQPVGVVAAITPWNFPFAMITRKVSPALAAGCPVVLKPPEQTPLTALKLLELAHEAGIPKDVFQIVTGDAKTIGAVMTSDPRVAKVSFTGSTEVGRLLMKQCADTVKKLTLELGGNAPFIVFKEADLDKAVDGLMTAKFRNAGQACVAANRVYLHESITEAFLAKLKPKVEALKVGNGLEDGVTVGPLIDERGMKKVKALVENAVAKGAKVMLGGKPHKAGDLFFEPTILTNVSPDMDLSCNEIFGPVIAIQTFTEEADVIQRANNTIHGLAAYFFTTDLAQAFRVSEQLDAGCIGVNSGLLGVASTPFGGMKQSGLGREGGKYGIEEYYEVKYVLMGVS